MKTFDITYFHGPFHQYIVKPEVIADIAASGITLVPIACDTETNKTVLGLLRRYGLKAHVHDPGSQSSITKTTLPRPTK